MRARVTVVEQVYYQLPDQQPMTAESRYQRWLDSSEQPYVRNVVVGPEWRHLDCGWVESASLLVLKNCEGEARRNLTAGQKDALAEMVLEVSFNLRQVCDVLVPPRESMRLCPKDCKTIMVRCVAGECRATVSAFPS